MQIRRIAKILNGQVVLIFELTLDLAVCSESVTIAWDQRTGSIVEADLLRRRFFPRLTEAEIRDAFGCLAGVRFGRQQELTEQIIAPASRAGVRETTRRVIDWIRRGMKKCQAAEYLAERGLKGWLWGEAVVDDTGHLRPATKGGQK